MQFVFIIVLSWKLPKYIKNKVQATCFYFIQSICLEVVSLSHFWHDFWRKIFLMLNSINWPNFIIWLSLLLKILGNMCIVIRTYSSSLLHVIIVCNHLPFLKIYSGFLHFCPNFQIFCPFSEKLHPYCLE